MKGSLRLTLDRLGYRLNPRGRDESACTYISSRGLLKSCTVHNSRIESSSSRLDKHLLRSLDSGGTLYICNHALRPFTEQVLPQIEVPFRLVSGDSVLTISEQTLGSRVVETLLDHPLLKSWFAQNLAIRHAGVHFLPIGMNYHSMTFRTSHRWGSFLTPLDQEKVLIETRKAAPRLQERLPGCYVNWHFRIRRGDRQEVRQKIDPDVMFLEPARLPRRQSWENNATYAFTISPQGVGMDCHRTWEALLLGSIPIVKSSPLDPLYDQLPVCIVKDWSEVNRAYIDAQRHEMLARCYDFSTLHLSHWAHRIAGMEPERLGLQTYQEFLDCNI